MFQRDVTINGLRIATVGGSIAMVYEKSHYDVWMPLVAVMHELDQDPESYRLHWMLSPMGATNGYRLPEDIPSGDLEAAFNWTETMARLGILRGFCKGSKAMS